MNSTLLHKSYTGEHSCWCYHYSAIITASAASTTGTTAGTPLVLLLALSLLLLLLLLLLSYCGTTGASISFVTVLLLSSKYACVCSVHVNVLHVCIYIRGLLERGTDNYIFHRGLQCAVLAKPWAETAPLFALKVPVLFIERVTTLLRLLL
jgi:hypothetical protein